MSIASIFQDARDKVTALSPNEVLKFVGLQVLPKMGMSRSRMGRPVAPLIAAFGAGLALGVGATLFLAPMSGKDTRAAVATWFKTAWSGAKDGLTGVVKRGEHAVETIAKGAENAAEQAKEGADDAKKDLNNGKSKLLRRDTMS